MCFRFYIIDYHAICFIMIRQNDYRCTCANANNNEGGDIIATPCMYHLDFLLFFFLSSRLQQQTPPPGQTVLSPDCDRKRIENASFWGLRRRLQRGPLTGRGRGFLAELCSAILLLQSSTLIVCTTHSIIDTD